MGGLRFQANIFDRRQKEGVVVLLALRQPPLLAQGQPPLKAFSLILLLDAAAARAGWPLLGVIHPEQPITFLPPCKKGDARLRILYLGRLGLLATLPLNNTHTSSCVGLLCTVCVERIYQASLRCTRCFVSLYELWPRCAHLCNSSFGAAALFLSRKLGQLGEPAPSAKCSQNKTLHPASSVHYQGIYCYHS